MNPTSPSAVRLAPDAGPWSPPSTTTGPHRGGRPMGSRGWQRASRDATGNGCETPLGAKIPSNRYQGHRECWGGEEAPEIANRLGQCGTARYPPEVWEPLIGDGADL